MHRSAEPTDSIVSNRPHSAGSIIRQGNIIGHAVHSVYRSFLSLRCKQIWCFALAGRTSERAIEGH